MQADVSSAGAAVMVTREDGVYVVVRVGLTVTVPLTTVSVLVRVGVELGFGRTVTVALNRVMVLEMTMTDLVGTTVPEIPHVMLPVAVELGKSVTCDRGTPDMLTSSHCVVLTRTVRVASSTTVCETIRVPLIVVEASSPRLNVMTGSSVGCPTTVLDMTSVPLTVEAMTLVKVRPDAVG